jgi:Sap, sulfolipid-1-addressing protein
VDGRHRLVLTPQGALTRLLLAGVNPKNLLLAAGAGAAVAGLALPTSRAVVSLLVLVVVASLTIAVPVVYDLVGGEAARTRLDAVKDWLAMHNDAVMTVLLLVLGVNLVF